MRGCRGDLPQLHAINAAVARIEDVTLPQIRTDGPGIADQLQVALRHTAVVGRRSVISMVQDHAGDLGAQTFRAVGNGDDPVMVTGKPQAG